MTPAIVGCLLHRLDAPTTSAGAWHTMGLGCLLFSLLVLRVAGMEDEFGLLQDGL